MIVFLNNLVEKGQFVVLTIWSLIFLFIVVFLAFILYKGLKKLKLKRADLKLPGGNSLVLEGSSSSEASAQAQAPVKKHDIQSFIFTINQIINFSVDSSSKASLKRQQLYNSQMRYIKDKFDAIIISIEYDFTERVKHSSQAMSLIIAHCVNATVVSKLDALCRADKLIERTKEKLLEEQKPLINGGYVLVANELKKYFDHMQEDESVSLQKAFESKKDEISKSLIECLEYCWEEASKQFEELQELQSILSDNVFKALKSYLDENELSLMPKEWYDKSKLPPNEVVGGCL